MADANLSDAAHPMANPGYGKRTAPYQEPRGPRDFAHLPAREAAVAAYVDRLPEGSDISVKTLAKHLPYGQCALRTSLDRIQHAGHLRRGREHLDGKWITRTWFSRAPRDSAWWAAFQQGDVPREATRRTRSRAYILLAALGRENSALSLSHAECRSLAPLVEEWFARDSDETYILRALTSGLPQPVHHPAGLVRRRLTDKLPPLPLRREPAPPRILECGKCGAPGYTDALHDGDCAPCRGERPALPRPRPATLSDPRVRVRAAEIRERMAARRG
ncbi:hypothetical protein [Streptomyces roseolus]|uniref:hypothetical protein n=1 Tax=Streptomyces roseolus TaxID=67358 RepID=UPI00199BC989|nr:hypothetical protein GCM10010282_55170 [Streptomyces roseolus]